ncbi:HDOD domain-containing protein [Aliamphritea spongicola]|nr:HDOD domain-containing protein [Aliamphritea spongicola]
MSTIQPYDAEEWTQYLTDKDFSVRASSLRRIQKALQSDKTSMKDLNRLIKADPLLCLHVVKAASILHAEKGSVVTGVEHAISSLGTDNLENLINGMKGTRLNAHSTADKMYFRATANSHHAAVQVRSWLERARKGMFTEESYLAALFYGIGHWALWHHAPLHMSQMQVKIREQGKDSETVERELLAAPSRTFPTAWRSPGTFRNWYNPRWLKTCH